MAYSQADDSLYLYGGHNGSSSSGLSRDLGRRTAGTAVADLRLFRRPPTVQPLSLAA